MVKEKFLLDTNIFITPYKTYYPMDLALRAWSNPKIPDVALKFGVKCVDIFYFMRSMNIKWK